eukprot:CAMPEP_0197654310 /NCGR_PEP_ID=MMETSP1338-20131121/38775_1 /TAXON_ID=43686 ORGANISM="Pelagodinium beii, Strain RCC1491" /NCGR_SAMPLE_ID=MMETSP1338 /ASSEMBLY_ACC=CAM_ASM_000754 /LENGTH=176 /DNA_ID=CAMNT_0043229731 /DNA_START=579 /DNA_END=1109 /DNA_ORIENTATION=+
MCNDLRLSSGCLTRPSNRGILAVSVCEIPDCVAALAFAFSGAAGPCKPTDLGMRGVVSVLRVFVRAASLELGGLGPAATGGMKSNALSNSCGSSGRLRSSRCECAKRQSSCEQLPEPRRFGHIFVFPRSGSDFTSSDPWAKPHASPRSQAPAWKNLHMRVFRHLPARILRTAIFAL